MNKRNIATTMVLLLSCLTFAVVGSCFINFVYNNAKINVQDPKVVVANGVLVYDKKDEGKKQISTLKFSDMELGLKPVTGKTDSETKVPSTVTDKNGSEGVYATVKVTAKAGLKVVVDNIKLSTKQDTKKVAEERENISISIKDVKDSTHNFKEDTITLTTFTDAITDKELTILFWLEGIAGDILKGCTISFNLNFVY